MTIYFIGNLNQKTYTVDGVIHKRWLENDDFVYFVNDIEESVFMFRKSDNSLASNNCFGENELYDDMGKGNYTWISRAAKNALAKMKEEYDADHKADAADMLDTMNQIRNEDEDTEDEDITDDNERSNGKWQAKFNEDDYEEESFNREAGYIE